MNRITARLIKRRAFHTVYITVLNTMLWAGLVSTHHFPALFHHAVLGQDIHLLSCTIHVFVTVDSYTLHQLARSWHNPAIHLCNRLALLASKCYHTQDRIWELCCRLCYDSDLKRIEVIAAAMLSVVLVLMLGLTLQYECSRIAAIRPQFNSTNWTTEQSVYLNQLIWVESVWMCMPAALMSHVSAGLMWLRESGWIYF